MTKPALAITQPDGTRKYVHPLTGEAVPSVTTIMKKGIPQQDWKVRWAVRMAAQHATSNWLRLSKLPHSEREKEMMAAHETYAQERADIGDIVHEIVECWSTGQAYPNPPKEVHSYVDRFIDFLAEKQPRFLENEVTLWSRTHGYAGTADFIIQVDGRTLLADLKCMVPETIVTMADGARKQAGDVHHGEYVCAWNGENFVPALVKACGYNGIQPVYRILTKCGREITVTAEHPVLTKEGWVDASDLRSGCFARTGWAVPAEKLYDKDRAYFLGLAVGDGSLGKNRNVRITTIDPLIVDFLENFGKSFGMRLSRDKISYAIVAFEGKIPRSPVTKIIDDAGLLGSKAATKFVPPEILSGGFDAWTHFLAGYLDTDGTVHAARTSGYAKNSRNGNMVVWGSRSKRLLEECQGMLAGLGIRSSLYTVKHIYKEAPYEFWHLAVRDKVALCRLQEVIPLRGARTYKLAELDVPPRSGRDATTSVLEWDEVISVESLLARPTVWLEVEGYHTHVTGGLVTHNTGKNLHDEIGLQLSALANCDFIIRADGREEPVPHVDGLAGLHLRPRSWKLVEVKHADACFQGFLAAKGVMEWAETVAPEVLPSRGYGVRAAG